MRKASLRTKITIAMVSLSGLLAFAVLYNFWKIEEIKQQKNSITQKTLPSKEQIREIQANLYSAQGWMSTYLETGNEEHAQQWKKEWNNAHQGLQTLRSTINGSMGVETSRKVNELQTWVMTNYRYQDEAINKIRSELKEVGFYSGEAQLAFKKDQLAKSFYSKLFENSKKVNSISQDLLVMLGNKAHTDLATLEASLKHTQWVLGLVAMVSILLAIVIGWLLKAHLKQSIRLISTQLKGLENGEIPSQINPLPSDETAQIHIQLHQLFNELNQVKSIAQHIGQGEFNTNISAFDNQGDLGESIATMKLSLSNVAQADRQRNWINEGFALFGDILRKHTSNIQALCDEVIIQLSKYMNANQGAVFLLHSDDNQQERLRGMACYAYDRKKKLQKEIQKGEGLVGQAWQENDTLILTDIPNEYITIKSGLGGSNPSSVLIVPLCVNDEMVGVIELASFQQFEEYQITFVKKLAETIAASILTTQRNEQTAQLLEDSRILTEMMKAQEEEMRQNMEELQTTQEEMLRAQTEIKRKEANLNALINNTQDTIFAIDTNYMIVVVNKTLKDKYASMGINLAEGNSIMDVLPEHLREKWKARYDRALAGEQYTQLEESSGSNGKKFVETYHNPIFDTNGKVIGVSVIARDVTQMMRAQEEIQLKESTLHTLIDNTDDTFCAVDKEYNILVVNEALKKRFAVSGISLEEGEYIFDKLPKEQHSIWKERYDRCLNGESFIITQERKVGAKTLIIEGHYHPVRDKQGAIIGASVMSKDITEWKQAVDEKALRDQQINKIKNQLGANQYEKLVGIN